MRLSDSILSAFSETCVIKPVCRRGPRRTEGTARGSGRGPRNRLISMHCLERRHSRQTRSHRSALPRLSFLCSDQGHSRRRRARHRDMSGSLETLPTDRQTDRDILHPFPLLHELRHKHANLINTEIAAASSVVSHPRDNDHRSSSTRTVDFTASVVDTVGFSLRKAASAS